jgi:hypothetical protein
MKSLMKPHRRWSVHAVLFAAACGPHGSGSPTYTIGGSITGLKGAVVLQNNDGDDLVVSADGHFVFAARLFNNASYRVSVRDQPTLQTCSVAEGRGVIHQADVTAVLVTCLDNDYWTLGSERFDETVSASVPSGFDPFLHAGYRPAMFPPYAFLSAQWGWLSATARFSGGISSLLYTGGGPSLEAGYEISLMDTTPGHATLVFVESTESETAQCEAVAGSLTVTHDGGPAAQITATYSISDWTARPGTQACPDTPTTGELLLMREPDNKYGNSGDQGDSFTVDGTTYTEGSTVLYDPFVEAFLYHSGSQATLFINARAGLQPDRTFLHSFGLNVGLPEPTSTDGGAFDIGPAGQLSYRSGAETTCLAAVAGDGTISLEGYGDVGSAIRGNAVIQRWFTLQGSCPATPWTVSFSATREADQ